MSEDKSAAILEVNTSEKSSLSKKVLDVSVAENKSDESSKIKDHSVVETCVKKDIIPVESFILYVEKENLPGFVFDIKATVNSPQRHVEKFETYMSYKITVKATRPEYLEEEYVVRRRYNDFCWLRTKLIETYPTRLIPPLPSKHSLLGHLDRYAKEFIMFRMTMLNRFLNRIIKHPILSYSEYLRIFLTANLTELSSFQKKNNIGFLSKMSGGIYNISFYTVKEKYSEFEEIKKYVNSFQEKLLSFEKIMSRMYKERKELTKDMNHLGSEFEKWSNSEQYLVPMLTSIAHSFHSISMLHETLLVNPFECVILQTIREYLLYVESIKEILIRRDSVQFQYESAIEELHKNKSDQMSIERTTNSDSNEIRHFSSDLSPKLVSIAEINHDKLQIANEDLKSDFERWSIEKKHDIKQILLALNNYYIQYYQKCIDIWEDNLKEINVSVQKD